MDEARRLNSNRPPDHPVTRAALAALVAAAVAALSASATAQPAPPGPPAATAPAATSPAATTAETDAGSRFSRTPDREIRFQEGLLNYSRNDLARAEADFAAVVKEDPADAEAHYYLGLTQLDRNRPQQAVDSFNQSIRIDPTADEVRAARASALIRLRRFDEADADLKVLEADPKWAGLTHYLRGRLLYAKGDFRGAQREFAAAKRAGGTERAPAEFYEGLTYLQMRELVRARSSFREAGYGPAQDPTAAAASRQLDQVLGAQARRQRRLDLTLTGGWEYDTNVILLGEGVTAPQDISDEADSRFVLQPRAAYTFLRNPRYTAGLEFNGYFTWQQELHDFDTYSYQGGPFLNYMLAKNWWLGLRYGYNHIEFGHDPYMTRHVVTPQLTWMQPNVGYTSGYYQFESREFEDEPFSPELDRNGEIHTAGLVQGINLPSFFRGAGRANLELSYRYELSDTDGSDYQGDFHTAGVTLYTPLPFGKLRGDVGAAVSWELYDNPHSLDIPRGREREDFEVLVSAGLSREINEYAAIRVDYTFTDHASNVELLGQDIFEYDRHQVGVRLVLTY